MDDETWTAHTVALHEGVPRPRPSAELVGAARNGVAATFALSGWLTANWFARVPAVRDTLHLSPGGLGLLLLVIAFGSMIALPVAGMVVTRFGPAAAAGGSAVLCGGGVLLASAGLGLLDSTAVVAVGLFLTGTGIGLWDVAMNVEGAEVERELGRTIMPRFHAAWSLGTVAGAGTGALAAAAHLPAAAHLAIVAVLSVAGVLVAVRSFLSRRPVREPTSRSPAAPGSTPRHALSAWRESRTLLLGLLVLGAGLTEGAANDWLGVGLVDGFGVSQAVGAVGLGVFLIGMTAGRWYGSRLVDVFGRVRMLRVAALTAAAGLLGVVTEVSVVLALVGAVLWGAGASLGFPLGMSAAADEAEGSAARVSVVASIGYTSFLGGPPLIGFLADHVGVLRALGVVFAAVLLVASLAHLARPPSDADASAPGSAGG